MDETLYAKLKKEIQTASWVDFAPHLERGAVLLVDEDLDLAGTALEIAHDDVESVQKKLQEQSLRRPSVEEMESLEKIPDRNFRFLIVQPYVLIQRLSN